MNTTLIIGIISIIVITTIIFIYRQSTKQSNIPIMNYSEPTTQEKPIIRTTLNTIPTKTPIVEKPYLTN